MGEDVVCTLVEVSELAVWSLPLERGFFTGSVSIITLLLGTMVSGLKSEPEIRE